MKKLFLSGPTTGYPLHNFPMFFEIEKELESEFKIVSPAKLYACIWINHKIIDTYDDWEKGIQLHQDNKTNLTQQDHLRNIITNLACCQGIVMLEGWQNSQEANNQLKLAKDLGLDLYQYNHKKKLLETFIDDGIKFSGIKRRWHLLYRPFIRGIVDILTMGAIKYKDDNWKIVKNARIEYLDAIYRHLDEYQDNKNDKESKRSHLYHLGCSLMFLNWFDDQEELNKKGEGNGYK